MSVHFRPEGYSAVTPYLVVEDAAAVLAFAQAAFDALLAHRFDTPEGAIMHADFTIDGAHIMLGQAGEGFPAKAVMLHLYLPDVDASYQRALAAGATSIRAPRDEFYGDRTAGVLGPSDTQWWIGTHIEDVSAAEMERRAAAAR